MTEEEREQKELFEFSEPKRSLPKLANIFPKPDFEGRVLITLTLEKLVFISIGIIMAMVVVFALGVEKGRLRNAPKQYAVAAPPKAGQGIRPVPPIAAIQPSVAAKKSPYSALQAASDAKDAGQKPVFVPAKVLAAPDSSRPYTIVAATFRKMETAQSTAVFLNKEGFAASVVYADPYYKVCVGTYADMYGTQVQRDLAKLRRIYKDAYMRLR